MDVNLTQNELTTAIPGLMHRGIDINFLEKLRQKLLTGNTRSVYLNCYPGRLATRLDLTSLDNVFANLSRSFLDSVLGSLSFNFEFRIDMNSRNLDEQQRAKLGIINRRLTSILYENNDNFLEHGIRTFGFGFPVLSYSCKSDPSKIVNAPVFIWKLEIKNNANSWTISRTEDNAIMMNETLLNYLESDLQTTGLTRLNEEALSDFLLDHFEVIQNANCLARDINPDARQLETDEPYEPVHSKDEAIKLLHEKGNPYLYKAGIFGLFRAPKEAIIRDIKELIKQFPSFQFDKLKTERYQAIPFSAVDTDPSQRKVLDELAANNRIVIHGPPGTGKSQSLTAIIANALVNGKKCLVVCEKRTALEVIKSNLAKPGLNELCGLIEDVNRDRKDLINSVRDRESVKHLDLSYDLNNIVQKTAADISFVNKGHRFYEKTFIDDLNWTALCGTYIGYNEKERIIKLYHELKELNFTFEGKAEFEQLMKDIDTNHKLYTDTEENTDKFALLEDSYLKNFDSAAKLQLDITGKIDLWRSRIKQLNGEAEGIFSSYSECLSIHYKEYHNRIIKSCSVLLDIYDENKAKQEAFLTPSFFDKIKLNIFKTFSSKLKKMKNDRIEFFDKYNELNESLRPGYYEAKLKDILHDDFSGSVEGIKNVKEASGEWINKISPFIDEKKRILSHENYDRYSKFSVESLNNITKNSSSLLNEPYTSDIFKKKEQKGSVTINEWLGKLREFDEQLAELQQNISGLADYYIWRIHFTSLDDKTQKTILPLISSRSKAWRNEAEMWYIFNLLLKHEPEATHCDDITLASIDKAFEKIKEYQRNEILRIWNDKQTIASDRFREKYKFAVNILYNKAKNNSFIKRNPLRTIIRYDFDLFTSFFPVLLVNPTVCSSLFELKEGLFDIVIFDEASQLKIEDVFCSKIRGKYRIVSGDENQMPPSGYFSSSLLQLDAAGADDEDGLLQQENLTGTLADAESLLDYSISKGYRETTLDIHYRSKHPDLINFSNAAFYGTRLTPMPEKNNYIPIRYYNSHALYDPDLGVNIDEARRVIELIEHIVTNNENMSVGVATLNIFQRNLILDMINEKCTENSEFMFRFSKMANIENEPFFIKNLENIQGDERDIIIISTTFGTRKNGVFTQNFGPINQEKGYRLLNVIITRAKRELYVITSIPESYIASYRQHLQSGNNTGRGIFYAYLAYAKAVSENDRETTESILNMLAQNSEKRIMRHVNPAAEPGTLFVNETANLLSMHIAPERIETHYKLGGFRIDIVIKDEVSGKPIIAIECDGTKYHSDSEAYAWDIFRQKQIEEHGLKFYRIWSKNWWNNQERELEKMVKTINEL